MCRKTSGDSHPKPTRARVCVFVCVCVCVCVPVRAASHQEPVDVHEQQRQQQGVEEEVEGDVGDRLQAGHTGGVQHLQGEPVQPEPEPEGGGDTERRGPRSLGQDL